MNKNGEELFDLKNDPGETENVINEYPKVVAQPGEVYDKWWKHAAEAGELKMPTNRPRNEFTDKNLIQLSTCHSTRTITI